MFEVLRAGRGAGGGANYLAQPLASRTSSEANGGVCGVSYHAVSSASSFSFDPGKWVEMCVLYTMRCTTVNSLLYISIYFVGWASVSCDVVACVSDGPRPNGRVLGSS